MKSQDRDLILSEDEQRKYRSGVGMLLYLVKFSQPDIANSVRELSKVMDSATMEHMICLWQLMKDVMDTKEKCLMMDLTKNSDSEKDEMMNG